MKPLAADYGSWSGTWAHGLERDGSVAYFNRQTGALVWDMTGQMVTGAEALTAEIASWPDSERERVPEFDDEHEAAAWLAERGFAVEWT